MLDAASKEQVAAHWSANVAGTDAFSPQVYWLAVPAVQRRHQRRACAGERDTTWVEYCLRRFLQQTPASRMLSIGCGGGALERDLYRLNAFAHCDAVDISSTAIDVARREAANMGAHTIDYRVADVEHADFPGAHYDAVWFNGSLHHIEKLEAVCERVCLSLKPGGWLFFNEYVGRNHFAFDTIQADAIRHAFALIPRQLRRSFCGPQFGEVQELVALPDPREVVRVDPSEAIRSQDILDVVSEYFQIEALHPLGGSLLQFLLHGIAGNFRQDDPQSMRVLQMLFDIEDGLTDSGVLPSDFVVVAARPKPAHRSGRA